MTICNHKRRTEIRSDGHFQVCPECNDEVYSSAYPVLDWHRLLVSRSGRKMHRKLFGRKMSRRLLPSL